MNRSAVAGAVLVCATSTAGWAAPWAYPGDQRLRHDLTLLADHGLIDTPVTTWPLPMAGLAAPDDLSDLPAGVLNAWHRVRSVTGTGWSGPELRLGASDEPLALRTFEDSPREQAELALAADYIGERVAGRLQLTAVSDPADGDELRADGSYAGVYLGNWMLSAGAIPRWWGPGRESSLILSTNARPVPQIALDRINPEPFETRWLSWLGPWSFHFFVGQLESDRYVPDAKLLGARLAFKPTAKLEVGLTRTAQWGGDGRPEDLDSLWNLFIGNDNPGARHDTITKEEEPGNQLAGMDIRWVSPLGDAPYALYTQVIGEDERNYMPIKHFAQAGVELWGESAGGSYRLHLEFADTTLQFWKDNASPNVVYEHGLYRSGYRYQGRSLGHAMDNDGRSLSLGLLLARHSGSTWSLLIRRAELNRDGTDRAAPGGNTVSGQVVDRHEIGLSHAIPLERVELRWGATAARLHPAAGGTAKTEIDAWIQAAYPF